MTGELCKNGNIKFTCNENCKKINILLMEYKLKIIILMH